MAHRRITPAMAAELRSRIGDAAMCSEPGRMAAYASDETRLVYPPELVVLPGSVEDVREIMRWASRHRVPVTPRAGGSNVTGGALAIHGGVVLSVMKMNRKLEIDEKNLVAIVDPGVITGDLHEAALERSLFYPPDPSSFASCTIGGNVAEGAGGPHGLKYGTTKDFVLGLEVVLPDGELLRTGGRTRKNVVGYDLTHLFVGSEGTLGVITEITLRLVPKPKAILTLLAPFDGIEAAVGAAAAILAHGVVPAALEMSRGNVLVPPGPQGQAIAQKTGAVLLIELDGHPAALEAERDEVGAVCVEGGALDVFVVGDSGKRKAIWDLRRGNWTRLVDGNAVVETLDPVVPLDRIVPFMRGVEEIRAKHDVPIYCGGHAGDGNVHTNIACRTDSPEIRARMGRAAAEVMALTVAMGGTIAGEHGIGCVKKDDVALELAPVSIDVQRRIKHLFDPLGIMNPGKMLPDGDAACDPFIVGGRRA
jgi:glycolate oxidase